MSGKTLITENICNASFVHQGEINFNSNKSALQQNDRRKVSSNKDLASWIPTRSTVTIEEVNVFFVCDINMKPRSQY